MLRQLTRNFAIFSLSHTRSDVMQLLGITPLKLLLLIFAIATHSMRASGSDRRVVFYFIGDSITQEASNQGNNGWAAVLQHKYVRSVDVINRGLAGYNTR